ncbi:hypothetical protein MHYP_G00061190 [Metynnis hypsauchen]
MEESEARLFLERNRSAVVNGVREVKRLVDFLMEKKYLLGEMPNEILTQGTKQDQMRELYRHLNTNIGFKLTLEWLRVNEPDLIEDLEKNSDADHAEPARKRPRSSAEAMDETDSDPNMPNLRCLSTLHKLEKWVSAPKNSKELIENVMVYTDPQTGERQIIVTDDKNSAAKNNLPKEIKILLNYQMWVCGIAKAVLINQKEREVQFDLQFLEGIKNHCEKFVFKALAPALAVFKNLQRQERLYSVIQKH